MSSSPGDKVTKTGALRTLQGKEQSEQLPQVQKLSVQEVALRLSWNARSGWGWGQGEGLRSPRLGKGPRLQARLSSQIVHQGTPPPDALLLLSTSSPRPCGRQERYQHLLPGLPTSTLQCGRRVEILQRLQAQNSWLCPSSPLTLAVQWAWAGLGSRWA